MFLIWVSFRGFAIVEIFRFYDEGVYECEIFSILTSVILAGNVIIIVILLRVFAETSQSNVRGFVILRPGEGW